MMRVSNVLGSIVNSFFWVESGMQKGLPRRPEILTDEYELFTYGNGMLIKKE